MAMINIARPLRLGRGNPRRGRKPPAQRQQNVRQSAQRMALLKALRWYNERYTGRAKQQITLPKLKFMEME